MSAPAESAPTLLVIGYGNTLRQDDSVGPRVAERIEAMSLPGVHTFIAPLLSPEHAELVCRAQTVVFVDAAVGASRKVQLQPLAPSESSQLMAHAADPRTLLALARDVFHHTPTAWLLTIPAVRLGFGENLSVTARRGVEQAVAEVTALLRNTPSVVPPMLAER